MQSIKFKSFEIQCLKIYFSKFEILTLTDPKCKVSNFKA